METPAAIAHLRETASAARAGDLAARRLSDVQALFGAEMAWVERELVAVVGQGMAPATDSARHLLEAGGKRVRPLAVLLAAASFGPVSSVARELAAVAELVHLATLLHDDVVDDGMERRGRPTSRMLWGNAVSVLAGDLVLTHALERTSAVASSAVLTELLATLRRLVDGEVVQLRGRTELDPREATYFDIVRDKTASLFRWATRAGAISAGAPRPLVDALGEYGAHLGIAFQLVDDLLDYAGDPSVTGKSLHADLREGKLTLPLILAVASEPALLADLRAARDADPDPDAARRLAIAVQAHRTCDAVRARAHEEARTAIAALELLPPSTARTLLAAIATELTLRSA